MGEIYPEEEEQKQRKPRFKKQTLVLDTYGVNLSKRAIEGKLDPVVGRKEEILRVIQIGLTFAKHFLDIIIAS